MRARLWRVLGAPLLRLSPHPAYGFRRRWLRLFGMRIAGSTKVRRSVTFDAPWQVSLGALTIVGDDAAFVGDESIRVGERCVVSQHAMLVTRWHDPRRSDHAPATGAIDIADDAWVATDVLVTPGAQVGHGAVVGARGTVEGAIPPWRVAVGRPAVARGHRSFDRASGAAAVGGGGARG